MLLSNDLGPGLGEVAKVA